MLELNPDVNAISWTKDAALHSTAKILSFSIWKLLGEKGAILRENV